MTTFDLNAHTWVCPLVLVLSHFCVQGMPYSDPVGDLCLQDWSNGSAAPPVMTESDKAKQGDKPAVTDTSLVVATKPATKSLLDDAYPDMLSIAATALDFWTKGKTEVGQLLLSDRRLCLGQVLNMLQTAFNVYASLCIHDHSHLMLIVYIMLSLCLVGAVYSKSATHLRGSKSCGQSQPSVHPFLCI